MEKIIRFCLRRGNKYTNYEVSDTGKIRHDDHILKTYDLDDREFVTLSHKHKGKMFPVHRLVLMAFNVPNPENRPEVDHIDSDSLNNNLENLRWYTKSENVNNPATKLKMKINREKKKVSS